MSHSAKPSSTGKARHGRIVRATMWLLTSALAGCSAGPDCPPYSDDLDGRSGPIAVIGDTQRALFVERLLLREQCGDEPSVLIQDIVAARPALLAHLGDAVANGASSAQWAYFDQLMAPVREVRLPLLPALGNHDYFGVAEINREQRIARFPILREQTWYERRLGDLALIWLDSNSSRMSRDQWVRQAIWFAQRVAAADMDAAVRGVVVFAHHAPYTNGNVIPDERCVQESFVPAFCAGRKTLAFITGHAHTYEHFRLQGKDFIVSGGGGGPRVNVLTGKAQRHPDLCTAPSPRPFHWLLLTPTGNGVKIEVRGLDLGQTDVTVRDAFTIPYASAPATGPG